MWTKPFWKGVIERMVRAAATTAAGILVSIDLSNFASVPWKKYMLASAIASAVSALTSIAGNAAKAGPEGSASLVYDRPHDDPASDGR